MPIYAKRSAKKVQADQGSRLRVIFLPNRRMAKRYESYVPKQGPDPSREKKLFDELGISAITRDLNRFPVNPWVNQHPFFAGFDPIRALRVLLFDRSADAVVTGFESGGAIIALLAPLFRFKLPIIMWEVSARGWKPRDKILDWMMPRIHKVFVLTKHQKQYVEEFYRLKVPADIVGFAFDELFFDPCFSRKGEYLLTVGDDFGRDFATLVAAVSDTNLHLKLKTRAAVAVPAEAAHRITTLPERISYVALRDLYASASIVVVPLSKIDHPSGITTLFEGMAMAKPVIATDVGSMRDFVIHGETGLLVPPGDVGALREAAVQLSADRAEQERLGRNARRFIEENCSMPAFTARFAKAIRSLITTRS